MIEQSLAHARLGAVFVPQSLGGGSGPYEARFRSEDSDERQQVRAHDTRSTFITGALANGRSETWVADRTGHRSSVMIQRYRRAVRTFAELGLGELASLAQAIPSSPETAQTKASVGSQE